MTWTRVASGAEVEQQMVVAVETGGEEIALYWIDGATSACPGEVDAGSPTRTCAISRKPELSPVQLNRGKLLATANVCSHAFARLSEGFLGGDCIECPIHQALFNVRSGDAIAGPATEPIKTYPCRIDGDDIWVDI